MNGEKLWTEGGQSETRSGQRPDQRCPLGVAVNSWGQEEAGRPARPGVEVSPGRHGPCGFDGCFLLCLSTPSSCRILAVACLPVTLGGWGIKEEARGIRFEVREVDVNKNLTDNAKYHAKWWGSRWVAGTSGMALGVPEAVTSAGPCFCAFSSRSRRPTPVTASLGPPRGCTAFYPGLGGGLATESSSLWAGGRGEGPIQAWV